VLEGLRVPVAVLVEDEDFFGYCVAENQIWVEHVDHPHERYIDLIGVNLFQVANVDDMSLNTTEHSCLVEDDLLSVREQLCVPAEVATCA